MKKFIYLIIILSTFLVANAQNPSVVYDYETNQFNLGGDIPSETYFTINGSIPADIGKVEVAIFKAGSDKALYSTEWVSFAKEGVASFAIPIKYKLRANKMYDFAIGFSRKTEEGDKGRIQEQLHASLDSYIDGITSVNTRKVSFSKSASEIMNDLDAIVGQSLVYYQPVTNFQFPGFSDIARTKVEQITDSKLSLAKANVFKKEDSNKAAMRVEYAQKMIGDLKAILRNETTPYVLQDAFVLSDQRKVKEVETENSTNYLTFQVGYGAIYMSGDFKDPEYLDGAYGGVVLPLGKPAFAPKFIQNASISAGVFFKNFEDDNGESISGPIVNRPIYLGLGYSFLRFVKFNVGGVILENKSSTGLEVDFSEIRVRPYVGLSAQFKISGKLDD